MISHRRTLCAATAGFSVLLTTQALRAVVTTIDGNVSAEVREFAGTTPGDSDFAFKDLSETTQTLPLDTVAELSHLNGEKTDAGARAQSTFSDPTVSVLPNPQEFSLNLAAFSQSPSISYTGKSSATETRTVNFLSEEIGSADGTSLVAQSQFFLDGIILVWGEAGITNLLNTNAGLTLKVEQSGGSLASPVTVLEAGLKFSGNADGSIGLIASGQLQAGNVISIDLTGQVPELGPVHALIIPQLSIPYTYNAKVGEAFTLKASIEGLIDNQPMTGASITLGVPLLQLAALLNSVTGTDTGDLLQQIVNAAANNSGQPSDPLPPTAKSTIVTVQSSGGSILGTFPSCGLFGFEGLMGVAALGLVQCRRRRC